jgi:hypothetical protein
MAKQRNTTRGLKAVAKSLEKPAVRKSLRKGAAEFKAGKILPYDPNNDPVVARQILSSPGVAASIERAVRDVKKGRVVRLESGQSLKQALSNAHQRRRSR